jgi:hypothetical protein
MVSPHETLAHQALAYCNLPAIRYDLLDFQKKELFDMGNKAAPASALTLTRAYHKPLRKQGRGSM